MRCPMATTSTSTAVAAGVDLRTRPWAVALPAKLKEPADHRGGAQPVGVEVADVADADDRRVDAVGAERGLAVVAVGVGGLLVGGGEIQPNRCPWCPVGAGAVGDPKRRGKWPGWVAQHLERVRGQ